MHFIPPLPEFNVMSNIKIKMDGKNMKCEKYYRQQIFDLFTALNPNKNQMTYQT